MAHTCSVVSLSPLTSASRPAHRLPVQWQPARTAGEDRAELEAFVRRVYAAAYGAQLRQLMPRLVGMRGIDGRLRAVLGLRAAADGPLFLEHYLSAPVEQLLAAANGKPVPRSRIMELGNLAAEHPGSARRMILHQALSLHRSDYGWVVFTITPALVNSFRRLGLELLCLGPARAGRLPEAVRAEWGNYYETRPMVYAGDIRRGLSRIRALLQVRGHSAGRAA